MPQYEGFVTKTISGGDAEVVIRPESPGILGAPHANVCHAASDSSSIFVKAENKVGAEAGDRVRIRREPGGLFKNALVLVGVPVLGFLAGLLASIILRYPLNIAVSSQVFMACGGLLLGAFVGTGLYRRFSGDPRLTITRVIQRGGSTPPIPEGNPACFQSGTTACEGCVGRTVSIP